MSKLIAQAKTPVLKLHQLERLPLGTLSHGENARKTYRPEQLDELADSLKSKGVLQNLIAYKENGKIKIAAGNRRLDALWLNQKKGAKDYSGKPFDGEYPVPVLLKPKAEALEDSLIENLQREEMSPLEEAEAFQSLHLDHQQSPEDIAERTGKPLEAVRKRLLLAKRLCPTGKQWLAQKTISLTQAQALTLLEPQAQEDLLEEIGAHFNLRQIQWQLKSQEMEVRHAIFDPQLYLEQGGVIHQDLFGKVEPYFMNAELAKRLQMEAAQAKVEALKQQWTWAELVVGDFEHWNYHRCDDKAKGGALVIVHPEHLAVRIVEGLVKGQPRNNPPQTQQAPRPTRKPLTRVGVVLTKGKKTQALQAALLGHHEGFRYALAVAVLGMLGEREVKLHFDRIESSDPLSFHPELQRQFALSAEALGLKYTEGRLEASRFGDTGLLKRLLGLSLPQLQSLFTALCATAVGSWVGFAQDEPSDPPLALALRELLGAEVKQAEVNEGWLKTLSNPRLMEVYAEMVGIPLTGTFTNKQLRALILERLSKHPDYLPKELSFHPKPVAQITPPRESGFPEPTHQEDFVEEDWVTDEQEYTGEDLEEGEDNLAA